MSTPRSAPLPTPAASESTRRAWRWLPLAAALPGLLWLAAALGTTTLARFGDYDHAVAWASVTAAQRAQLEASIGGHAVFARGSVGQARFDRHRPTKCPADAVAVGFSGLFRHELGAAQRELDAVIDATGARRCPVRTFVFGDVPAPFDALAWPRPLPALVLLVLMPAGIVAVAFLALRGQGLVDGSWHWPGEARARRDTLLVMLLLVALPVLAWASGLPAPAVAVAGPASWAARLMLLVLAPWLEEACLRAWWMPLSSRAIGPAGAATLSALASAAFRSPDDGAEWLLALATGALLALLFQRTRSLPACVLANSGATATLMVLGAATA